jgi:hypothetical protein
VNVPDVSVEIAKGAKVFGAGFAPVRFQLFVDYFYVTVQVAQTAKFFGTDGALGPMLYNFLSAKFMNVCGKLERLSLAGLSSLV